MLEAKIMQREGAERVQSDGEVLLFLADLD
jgi:hypothetical protein